MPPGTNTSKLEIFLRARHMVLNTILRQNWQLRKQIPPTFTVTILTDLMWPELPGEAEQDLFIADLLLSLNTCLLHSILIRLR
ncbi:hypothetical protein D3C86_1444360 [compost metagenome]